MGMVDVEYNESVFKICRIDLFKLYLFILNEIDKVLINV